MRAMKLVNYNSTINSPIMTTFVGVDNYELGAQMGRYVAKYVADQMGGKAKIALLTIPNTRSASSGARASSPRSGRCRG